MESCDFLFIFADICYMIKRKDRRDYMVIAQELGEKITRMFNFIYEVNNDYYILGRDYFRLCTDLEIGVYGDKRIQVFDPSPLSHCQIPLTLLY